VANGGLGAAFDELELQRVMMQTHGVKIRGVVLNHVRPEKLNMVQVRERQCFGAVGRASLSLSLPRRPKRFHAF
jgi:hypothetical protein